VLERSTVLVNLFGGKMIKNIKLEKVEMPDKKGFYIAYNKFMPRLSMDIIHVTDDKDVSGIFHGKKHSINEIMGDTFIAIRVDEHESCLPTESGVYWIWRDDCIESKSVIFYDANKGHYKTIGDEALYSIRNIQGLNWKKIQEPI
jgi:hypothetical protein